MDLSRLTQRFYELFGGETERERIQVVRAPGRVNLIGEHTDYNDGFVLPIAIEREMVALVRRRRDANILLRSTGQVGEARVHLSKDLSPRHEPRDPKWASYCRGVIYGLTQRGLRLSGAEVLFDSTIPLGAGLSSSAALEVATALAMQLAAGFEPIGSRELALLCQQAEHTFAGTPCGIMDQSIVVMGQPGDALLLDCRNGETRQVPFDDPKLVLLVCDTQVKHQLNDGGYAARRAQCESAAQKLGVKALRDASAEQVAAAAELSDVERKRARHVVGEIERTTAAVTALEQGDYAAFGKLMYASHESLRDDYDVSCEELDAIVELARASEGVYGARMTGGGFGGCAIVLAAAERAEEISRRIAEDFAGRFGRECPIFATRAAQGAGVL